MAEVEVIRAADGPVARRRDIEGKGVRLDRIRVAAYVRVSTDGEEQLALNKKYPTGSGCSMEKTCPVGRRRSSVDSDSAYDSEQSAVSLGMEVSLPAKEAVLELLGKIREYSAHVPKQGTEHEHMSRMVAWYSRKLTCNPIEEECAEKDAQGESAPFTETVEIGGQNGGCLDAAEVPECPFTPSFLWHRIIENMTNVDNVEIVDNYENVENSRIALSAPIIYAYLSLCRSWKNYNDCRRVDYEVLFVVEQEKVRGP